MTEWDNRYRALDEGEIIRPTDECRSRGRWVQDNGQCAGTPAPSPYYTSHRWYRRRGHRLHLRVRHRFIPFLYYRPANHFRPGQWCTKGGAPIYDPAMLKRDIEIPRSCKWIAEVTG